MPYTVHTLDGQAHTYPDPVRPEVSHDGQALTMRTLPKASSGEYVEGWHVSVYAPGQWTHYHVEPAPYKTGAQANEDTDEAQRWTKIQPDTIEAAHDRWKATYQQHLNAGRKAAEAQ